MTFSIGSSIFFSTFPDYKTKDNDILTLVSPWTLKNPIFRMKEGENDVFFMNGNLSGQELLELHLGDTLPPMAVGKFLSPEFSRYLGLSVSDLKRLHGRFESLDEKHRYENIIYKSYIKNNDFFLTKDDLGKAWEEYKKERPEIYKNIWNLD